MYCSYCGKEIPEDAKFCPYCGKSNLINNQNTNKKQNTNQNRYTNKDQNRYTNSRHTGQRLSKEFSFGAFTSNDQAVKEINTWLSNQSIFIFTTSIFTVQSGTGQKISHCEIRYQEEPGTTKVYQMGYFSRWHWVGTNFSSLDRDLDNWKAEYPQYEVTYSIQKGNSTSRTLYFLYTYKR